MGALIESWTGLLVGVYAIFLAGASLNALEVSKSLIDVNAALLGFLGLIVVFMLTAVGDAKRLAEERIYRVTSEHEREVRKEYPGLKEILGFDPLKAADVEYKSYKKRVKELEDFVETLDSNSSIAYGFCLGSAAFFVLSILLCLIGMSETPPSARLVSVFLAICFFAVGTILVELDSEADGPLPRKALESRTAMKTLNRS